MVMRFPSKTLKGSFSSHSWCTRVASPSVKEGHDVGRVTSRRTDDGSYGKPSRRLTSRASRLWLPHSLLSPRPADCGTPFHCVLPGELRLLRGGNVCCYADVWRAERHCHGRCQLGVKPLCRRLRRVPLSPTTTCSDPRRVEQKAPRGVFTTMVCDMVSPITSSSRRTVESNALFVLSRPAWRLVSWCSRCARFPRTWLFRPAKESDCCGSHVKRASTISVIVYEVQGEVLSGGEGHDVGRLVRTDVAKYTMSVGEPRHDAP